MPRSLFTLGWMADRYGKRYLLAGGYFLVVVMVAGSWFFLSMLGYPHVRDSQFSACHWNRNIAQYGLIQFRIMNTNLTANEPPGFLTPRPLEKSGGAIA